MSARESTAVEDDHFLYREDACKAVLRCRAGCGPPVLPEVPEALRSRGIAGRLVLDVTIPRIGGPPTMHAPRVFHACREFHPT